MSVEVFFGWRGGSSLEEAQSPGADLQTASIFVIANTKSNEYELERARGYEAGVNCVCSQVSSFKSVCMTLHAVFHI